MPPQRERGTPFNQRPGIQWIQTERTMLCTFVALTALTVAAPNAGSTQHTFNQRANLAMTTTTSGCDNSPGPYITVNGSLTLSGVNARIILTNNRKFTHVTSADVTADVEIIPLGKEIKIAKQPVLGGVGGNPWFYLQFTDGKKAYGKPQLLGRCKQGLDPVSAGFDIPTKALTTVSGSCSNRGPDITLSGELRLGGLSAKLILTNNAKFTHVSKHDVVVDLVLLPAGESIVFAKQPPLGGAGGNPFIYVQFLDTWGNELSAPTYVGRCNRL